MKKEVLSIYTMVQARELRGVSTSQNDDIHRHGINFYIRTNTSAVDPANTRSASGVHGNFGKWDVSLRHCGFPVVGNN